MKHLIQDSDKLVMASILVAVNNGDPIMGRGSLPSGHVYARLMGSLGLQEYYNLITVLKAAGLITQKGNVLYVTAEGEQTADQISQIIKERETEITVN